MADELAALGFQMPLCQAAMRLEFLTMTEERVEWILGHVDADADEINTFEENFWAYPRAYEGANDDAPDAAADASREYKMVIVVRSDLGMSPGKVASQCVHAALGCVRLCHAASSESDGGGGGGTGMDHYSTVARLWESTGEKVVCLRCDALPEMQRCLGAARARGIPAHAVRDAGRTEIEPGSITCLAIGPDSAARIDGVTGKLRLY
jgi:PTH2 family peptidyl-tRNA hydrolase